MFSIRTQTAPIAALGVLLAGAAGCDETVGDRGFQGRAEALEGGHDHPDPPGDPAYVSLPDAGASTVAMPDQVALSAADIPKFAQELSIPPVLVPEPVEPTDCSYAAAPNPLEPRLAYHLALKQTRVQMLPPPLPATTVLAYGGNVRPAAGGPVEFGYFSPGPTIEATRGVPHALTFSNGIDTPHFLAVDPTLHWANPNNMEPPTSPFLPFPPGYAAAQFPIPHVTHTHGLMVESEMDGLARQWFTAFGQRGPHYLTQTYRQPNDQPSTHLWYHDHTIGMTRLNVYAGLTGDYFIRDPNHPLDYPARGAERVLPTGKYEIPLVIADRGFFTDGELNFGRTGINPDNPYWTVILPTNTNIVNGKVWPNLNVERRQYRFRIRIAANDLIYVLGFDNSMSFTIIGSDGGYLPRPQVVQSLRVGSTERADVLVDFSSFEPGTKIVMQNRAANNENLGTVMQFTVQDGPSIAAPPLPETLSPIVPLVQDSRTRTKTQQFFVDARGNIFASLDGLMHGQQPTEYPLVGSTERWDLVETTGLTHLIHLHLIEFQLVERRPINTAAYNLQWALLNGQPPVNSRPIVVDPTPFFTGPAVGPAPYETGWKDTIQATGGMLTSILARWAPQELPVDEGGPGTNRFSIDPTTGPGYLWHCHILEHEDNEMMRDMPLINLWKASQNYDTATVVQYQGVNYRALRGHTSAASAPPPTAFETWERVNDDNGEWAAQIQYVVGDRVLFNGALFMATQAHQARAGQEPPNAPALWEALPLSFCGQLDRFCADDQTALAQSCRAVGAAGDEAACQAQFSPCIATCAPSTVAGPGATTEHHQDYASYCGQLAGFCHSDETSTGVACHDLGHAGDEAACQARHAECLAQCAPSRPTPEDFAKACR